MSVIPLRARCANCGADELLSRIADGDGICRACHLSFCDDNTLRFLQDVVRADVAYRLLVRSLRRLSTPSVGLRVLAGPAPRRSVWSGSSRRPWRPPRRKWPQRRLTR
jgi:hypothetical protein